MGHRRKRLNLIFLNNATETRTSICVPQSIVFPDNSSCMHLSDTSILLYLLVTEFRCNKCTQYSVKTARKGEPTLGIKG